MRYDFYFVAELKQAGRLDEASKVLLHDPVHYPPPWNRIVVVTPVYDSQQMLYRGPYA